ncbi:MAG: hypothetical protein K0R48_1151 [Gammaproteobacteria bacterium]|jgi:hypothetical protein|nr:hypothetical protein [Gammaproteobacteria bacterium]
MNKKIWVVLFLAMMMSSPLLAAASSDGTLHCIPHEIQFNDKGEIHFGAPDNKAQFFLVRSQYDTPLVIDFPAGHIGASAGLTQVLGPRSWAVYVYKATADTIRTEAGLKPPFWNCTAAQDTAASVKTSAVLQTRDCRQSVWTCALTSNDAATILSARYQQQAEELNHSFWLPLGDTQYQSVYFLTDLQKN